MAAPRYWVGDQSTGDVDADGTIDFWRAEVGGRQCMVGFDAPHGYDTFRGATKVLRHEDGPRICQIVEFTSSAVRYQRHRHQLGDDTDKRALIPVEGPITLMQEDRDAELFPGELGIITMAREMGLAHDDGARALIVTIPDEAIPDLTDTTPIALDSRDGAVAAVVSMAGALVSSRKTTSAESYGRVFSALTDLLAGSVDPRREQEYSRYSTTANMARGYVRRHCRDPRVDVPAIAEHLNVSPRYLATALARVSGTTPGKLLRRTRLELAARMLRTGETRPRIAEVAFECGFGSVSGFREAWRDHFGMSVSEWRERGLTDGDWRALTAEIAEYPSR